VAALWAKVLHTHVNFLPGRFFKSVSASVTSPCRESQMLIRPNIKAMFHRLNDEHFNGEIPDIPVVWNTRMTTTAGYCRYKRSRVLALMGNRQELAVTKIDLSDKLFRHLDFDEDKIESTLVHEMVHAYLVHKFNEKGHTRRFQNMMIRITGEHKNHRCHNYDTVGIRKKQVKKIHCECNRCGFTYEKARMPKYAGMTTYTHRGCGGAITFTRMDNVRKIF
jgi:predicted SprT family Zn-dependent metalloprotease